MGKTYSHLSPEERAAIMSESSRQTSCQGIARRLGRSVSTVSRELSRNRTEHGEAYDATVAAKGYRARRERSVRRRKLVEGSDLYQRVRHLLIYLRRSAQQITARLRKVDTNNPTQSVTTKRSTTPSTLNRARGTSDERGVRRTSAAGASFVPEELRIVNRPEEIAQRLVPEHWVGDFIKGAFNRSAVGTLVERKTRFVVLCKMGAERRRMRWRALRAR